MTAWERQLLELSYRIKKMLQVAIPLAVAGDTLRSFLYVHQLAKQRLVVRMHPHKTYM
jgi:hypothetical protein